MHKHVSWRKTVPTAQLGNRAKEMENNMILRIITTTFPEVCSLWRVGIKWLCSGQRISKLLLLQTGVCYTCPHHPAWLIVIAKALTVNIIADVTPHRCTRQWSPLISRDQRPPTVQHGGQHAGYVPHPQWRGASHDPPVATKSSSPQNPQSTCHIPALENVEGTEPNNKESRLNKLLQILYSPRVLLDLL